MASNSRSYYRDIGAVWVSASNGELPPDAVPGGQEAHGQIIYVARFHTKEGQLTPGKFNPEYKQAYIGYNGQEQSSGDCQILTHPNQQDLKWVPCDMNNVPTGALQAGGDYTNPIFIGRAPFEGGLCCGKFLPDRRCLYLSWGGREHAVANNVEVLCLARVFE